MNSNLGHELDSNYDYRFAAEQKKNPQKGLAQVMGERALSWAGVTVKKAGNWLRSMNEKRKSEKAERQQNGSLEVFYNAADQHQRQEAKEPRPVASEPGLYRSNFSGEQPMAVTTERDNNDIMQNAVSRARKALGELPVLTLHQPQPERSQDVAPPYSKNPQADERNFGDWTAEEDAALIARLKNAYEQPARQDNERNTAPPDRKDDDHLVGTQGK